VVVISPRDHRQVPWRNGRGSTADIAWAGWPQASGEQAAWRLSLADIAEDAPFSDFAGFDRVILLAEGAGFVLEGGGREAVTLAPPPIPIAFPGEWAPACRLLGGPVRALNVITARGRARAEVAVARLSPAEARRLAGADPALCYVLDGAVSLEAAGQARALARGETAVVARVDAWLEAGAAGALLALAAIDLSPRPS
jgi:environmental stress-induced protein Ves